MPFQNNDEKFLRRRKYQDIDRQDDFTKHYFNFQAKSFVQIKEKDYYRLPFIGDFKENYEITKTDFDGDEDHLDEKKQLKDYQVHDNQDIWYFYLNSEICEDTTNQMREKGLGKKNYLGKTEENFMECFFQSNYSTGSFQDSKWFNQSNSN